MNQNIFTNKLINWKIEIQKDEWFFSNFRDSLIDNITDGEAFFYISQLCEIINQNDDSYFINELLEILLALARKSNTTEIPNGLKNTLIKLDFDPSLVNSINNIKDFYRLS
ncbi:hypothetical protein [Treponema sp.]|uniref:hypothetical protein n=1 Tax=Treponema sp. TaxID=166 RepID=UPI00298DB6EF|nr:hypothetical protein [Treponema sp.]